MLKMIQKKMNKRGFTLVELIIVIAVMAILAAIVVPRMGGITNSFRTNADERLCDQYAREIEVQIQTGNTPAAATALVPNQTTPQIRNNTNPAGTQQFYYRIIGNVVYVWAGAAGDVDDVAEFNAFTGPKVSRDSGGVIE